MTAFQPVGLARREIVEIDALLRALCDLRHWSASAAARKAYHDDLGRRRYATAARQRDEAWVNSLDAAYRLFEIDAIHDSWIEAGGRPA
ncbi:hypothetical protein [Rhizorhabdus argentea]|uniref:hypothetical protein n=1 Tax=Rhizorhabdus argentea TaxID=1387174 RepID=UPI0030EF0A23